MNWEFIVNLNMITDINQLDFTKQYTYADYLTWRFTDRVELIKGWIKKMSPAPNMTHQKISFNLCVEIGTFFKTNHCKVFAAPFDVRLINKRKSTDNSQISTVVQPDLCIICDENKLDENGCIGAPDWIIEILSPGNTKKETQEKFSLYEENLVKEYWIVQPGDQNILVFDLIHDKYQLRKIFTNEDVVPSRIFAELHINFADIF